MHTKSGTSQSDNSIIHVGRLVQKEMKRTGRKASWFAEQLGCHRNNVYLIFRRSWIDTETLMHISQILEHDFFADISKIFKEAEECKATVGKTQSNPLHTTI